MPEDTDQLQINSQNIFAEETIPLSQKLDLTSSRVMGKIFLYAFIGFFITGAITFGLGYGMYHMLMTATPDVANTLNIAYIITLIVSSVGTLVMALIMTWMMRKRAIAVWVSYIIFAVLIGVVLSSFAFAIDPMVMGLCFLVVAVSFALMALIGLLSKGRLKVVWQMVTGLTFGALLIGLSLIVFMFVLPQYFDLTYILLMSIMYVIVCLFVIIDVNRLKNLTNAMQPQKSLQVFFAFILYLDLVRMLIYALRFAAMVAARRR